MVRTVSLAFSDWPDADQRMWLRLIVAGGPLDDAGALSGMKATTLASLRRGYERWLRWILDSQPGAEYEGPPTRATPQRLVAWLDDLAGLAPQTRHTLLYRTVRVLSAASPDMDWSAQRRIVSVADRSARRFQSKRKIGRVLPSNQLLAVGEALATEMAAQASTSWLQALLNRNGTMVAMLALLPMRLRSFSELRLGSSVHMDSTRISITLSPEMTKNGLPWDTTLPRTVEVILRHYIDGPRSLLMARHEQRHDALWVDRCGHPLKASGIAKCICAATTRMTGVRVSPHLFRDAAATTLSRSSPENARLIRPLLAHSGFGTAERHYIQAQGIETGRDYASVLAGLMEDE